MSKRKKIKLVGVAAGIVLALALVSPAIAGRGSHPSPRQATTRPASAPRGAVHDASSDTTLSVLTGLRAAENNDDVAESPEPTESPDVAESPGDDDQDQLENEQPGDDDQAEVDDDAEVTPGPEPTETPDVGDDQGGTPSPEPGDSPDSGDASGSD
jgi:hypothetical protein